MPEAIAASVSCRTAVCCEPSLTQASYVGRSRPTCSAIARSRSFVKEPTFSPSWLANSQSWNVPEPVLVSGAAGRRRRLHRLIPRIVAALSLERGVAVDELQGPIRHELVDDRGLGQRREPLARRTLEVRPDLERDRCRRDAKGAIRPRQGRAGSSSWGGRDPAAEDRRRSASSMSTAGRRRRWRRRRGRRPGGRRRSAAPWAIATPASRWRQVRADVRDARERGAPGGWSARAARAAVARS